MITVTRKIEFDAGHRVLGHEGKCKNLHGHRYVAEITVSAPGLDTLGRVVDFSVIKERVGGWVDRNWDHNILLNRDDPQFKYLTKTEEVAPFPFDSNPTAENMAKLLFYAAEALLMSSSLTIVSVRIWETPNCYADYKPD